MAALILAIDAGGSTTRCLLARVDGTVLASGTGGPGNHILAGWATARESLRRAVTAALSSGVPHGDHVAVVSAGSAGIGAGGEGREAVESLLAELVPGASACAAGDMVAAFWGALAEPVGVVVAAGTGSVCFGRNAGGAICQVGGWGPVMGDEGSAYDIALAGLRAAARATDGRGPATAIGGIMAAALGGHSALDVARRVYGDPLGRDQLAALATAVTRAAENGDEVAVAIVAAAGGELASMAGTAARTLGLLPAPTISYAGAVYAAASVRAAFTAAVHAMLPEARIEPPLLPPIGGAFRLGVETWGTPIQPAAVARLRAHLTSVES